MGRLYEEQDGQLILKTENGDTKYVFEIKDHTLIFNREESSGSLSKDIPDGAIFK